MHQANRIPHLFQRTALCVGLLLPAFAAVAQKPAQLEFNRDIRPILSDNCFACHGPNKTARQAGLRLDERTSALQTGAIVPGKPEKSSIIQRINGSGPIMPPLSSHKALTPAQKSLLKSWIAQGAPYQPYWAYAPIVRPAVPKVAATTGFVVRNPIDSFILQRLIAKGIRPSAQADKRTLIRRVSLDVIGLPPTPAEVQEFVNDKRPDAYDRLITRLLASPHYGERMAIPWLDQVRYADTVGFHGDQNMNAWPYRDYVINSFNTNKPFSTFTIEQIAGDLLPNPTPQQLTATCFNRLNMVTREGGAQPKEYLAKYQADRVRTVSLAFLGSTFACAECHDHKYDPITQRDFYSLGCFFADMKQWGVYEDYGYTPNPDLKGTTNDSPFPPEITITSPYLLQRIAREQGLKADAATAVIAAARRGDGTATRAIAAWAKTASAFLGANPSGWERPLPTLRTAPQTTKKAIDTRAAAPQFECAADGLIISKDSKPGDVTADMHPTAPGLASIRVEFPQPAESLKRKGMQTADVMIKASVTHADGRREPLSIRYAGADVWEPRYANGYDLIGVHRRWRIPHDAETKACGSTWLLAKPIPLETGDTVSVTLETVQVTGFRIGLSPFVPEHCGDGRIAATLKQDLEALQTGADLRTEPVRRAAVQYIEGTAADAAAYQRIVELDQKIFNCREGLNPVMVTEAKKEPLVMRILARGNWQDESGPIVEPAVPGFLPHASVPTGRRLNRLDLAKWLVAPENPLTARVFVNRLWKMYFGIGISGQGEDLGVQGEWPTHPELLDWLASEFRASGWDVKHMVRLIVTSAAYRQSSQARPELKNIDPGNRLLAAQNPRRLEAELVRDNALSIAGALCKDLGGPPCFPYQPAGYYTNIQFPDRDYYADNDERQYRRGVYMHWQRTFLHPMLANFDAPSREDCTGLRTNANTPQQALTLLNDPEFVEAARITAISLLKRSYKSDADRIEALFQRAVNRPAKAEEKSSLLAFLNQIAATYKQRPGDAEQLQKVGNAPTPAGLDANTLAAWTSVCRVVLNLHETITRY
jgi:Protein of unknown function (DUF1553)/Protein of unknown function (DUF1549)/Planctomycete cytochrome C